MKRTRLSLPTVALVAIAAAAARPASAQYCDGILVTGPVRDCREATTAPTGAGAGPLELPSVPTPDEVARLHGLYEIFDRMRPSPARPNSPGPALKSLLILAGGAALAYNAYVDGDSTMDPVVRAGVGGAVGMLAGALIHWPIGAVRRAAYESAQKRYDREEEERRRARSEWIKSHPLVRSEIDAAKARREAAMRQNQTTMAAGSAASPPSPHASGSQLAVDAGRNSRESIASLGYAYRGPDHERVHELLSQLGRRGRVHIGRDASDPSNQFPQPEKDDLVCIRDGYVWGAMLMAVGVEAYTRWGLPAQAAEHLTAMRENLARADELRTDGPVFEGGRRCSTLDIYP